MKSRYFEETHNKIGESVAFHGYAVEVSILLGYYP
jgi:hypothetical protein